MNQINKIEFRNQKFFIGIDVHLKSWKITIRNNGLHLKTFSMNPSPFELHRYMNKHYPGGQYHSVYEAGFSGYWIHRDLTKLGFHSIVVHPADVPTTDKEKKTKSDVVDSRKLARELESGKLKSIYVPDELHQQLRSLQRLRQKQIQHSTRLKNRIKGHLYANGITIPSHHEVSHWSGRFISWLKTIDFAAPAGYDYLNLCIEELEICRQRIAQIAKLLRKYSHQYGFRPTLDLLMSVPGVGFVTATAFFTELVDINRFHRFPCLCAYVGLMPSVAGSGEKEFSRGITKRRNRILRYLIIEAAWKAIRTDPGLLHRYHQLTRRMKPQDAIIRIARKLLNRIRYVWKNRQPYVCLFAE
jgi:transposase